MSRLLKFCFLGIVIAFVSQGMDAEETKFKRLTPTPIEEVVEVAPPPTAPAVDLPPAKAVITDVHGQPLPEEAALGEAIVLSARTSIHGCKVDSIKWIVLPQERNARKYVSNDGLDVFIPTGTKPVVITGILAVSQGDTVDITMISVKCGQGAQPPPDPKPDPKPDPGPTPIQKQKLMVSMVYNVRHLTADTAAIQNSTVFWNNLKLMGHDYVFYDEDTPEANGKIVVAEMKKKNLQQPALVFQNRDTKNFIDVIPLPKTLLEVTNNVKKYSGEQ